MGEVEPEPIRLDQRPGLVDVLADHLAQRPVQDVGAGVVLADPLTAVVIDLGDVASWPVWIDPVDHRAAMPVDPGHGILGVGDPNLARSVSSRCRVSPTWPPDSA